jgi:hypothetical protein
MGRCGRGLGRGIAQRRADHIGGRCETECIAPRRSRLALAAGSPSRPFDGLMGCVVVGRDICAVGIGNGTEIRQARVDCLRRWRLAAARCFVGWLEGDVAIGAVAQYELPVGGGPEEGRGEPKAGNGYGCQEPAHGWIR